MMERTQIMPNDEVKEQAKRTATENEYLLEVKVEALRRKHEMLLRELEELQRED